MPTDATVGQAIVATVALDEIPLSNVDQWASALNKQTVFAPCFLTQSCIVSEPKGNFRSKLLFVC